MLFVEVIAGGGAMRDCIISTTVAYIFPSSIFNGEGKISGTLMNIMHSSSADTLEIHRFYT